MLSKCANPLCCAPFRYLHEGRIFNIEVGAWCENPNGDPSPKIEHFWLCSRCARTLKVVLSDGRVKVRPRHLELPASRAAAA